jgi:hypothetical protein
VAPLQTAAIITATTEIGTEVETDNMIEATATGTAPRLRHVGEEDRIEIEIARATDRQAMTVEVEAGAEGRVRDDHDVMPYRQTRKSWWKD